MPHHKTGTAFIPVIVLFFCTFSNADQKPRNLPITANGLNKKSKEGSTDFLPEILLITSVDFTLAGSYLKMRPLA